jgi:hypothetical protein
MRCWWADYLARSSNVADTTSATTDGNMFRNQPRAQQSSPHRVQSGAWFLVLLCNVIDAVWVDLLVRHDSEQGKHVQAHGDPDLLGRDEQLYHLASDGLLEVEVIAVYRQLYQQSIGVVQSETHARLPKTSSSTTLLWLQ